MNKDFKIVAIGILLTGMAVGSYFSGEYVGRLSGNQTDIGKTIYTQGYLSGNQTGWAIGYEEAHREGVSDGRDERIKFISESTKGGITWK
jgi:hypothetical protein